MPRAPANRYTRKLAQPCTSSEKALLSKDSLPDCLPALPSPAPVSNLYRKAPNAISRWQLAPDEVLQLVLLPIFKYCTIDDDFCCNDSQQERERRTYRLSHVCRQWRQVMLFEPKFWAGPVLNWSRPPPCVEAMLWRSNPATLDIVFPPGLAESSPPVLFLALKHLGRARRVQVTVNLLTWFIITDSRLLSEHAPHLETFDIRVEPTSLDNTRFNCMPTPSSRPKVVFRGHTPLLRSLILSNLSFPLTKKFYGITNLVLESVYDLSFVKLFDFLANLKELESLSVKIAGMPTDHQEIDINQSVASGSKTIFLPHLKTLAFQAPVLGVFGLFQRLGDLPATCSVSLNCFDVACDYIFNEVLRYLNAFMQYRHTKAASQKCPIPSTLRLEAREKLLELQLIPQPKFTQMFPSKIALRLHVSRMFTHSSTEAVFSPAVAIFQQTMSPATILDLHIYPDITQEFYTQLYGWLSTCKICKHLACMRVFDVSTFIVLEGFFAAQAHLATLQLTDLMAYKSVASLPCLPKLHTLILFGVDLRYENERCWCDLMLFLEARLHLGRPLTEVSFFECPGADQKGQDIRSMFFVNVFADGLPWAPVIYGGMDETVADFSFSHPQAWNPATNFDANGIIDDRIDLGIPVYDPGW